MTTTMYPNTEDALALETILADEARAEELRDEIYAEHEAEALAERQADEALERRYEEMGGYEPPEDYSMDPQLNGELS